QALPVKSRLPRRIDPRSYSCFHLFAKYFSAADQPHLREPLVVREIDDRAGENALPVFATWIDEGDRTEATTPPRLVDVAVQAEQRLVFQDRVAHRGAAHRNHFGRARSR